VGQKVHPKGFRTGIYRDWEARWFAPKKTYGDGVLEDIKARRFLDKSLEKAEVGLVEIEKAADAIKFIVHSARPGNIIGKGGQGIETIKKQLADLLGKTTVEISVQEIKTPELDAVVVAKSIASQLEKRVSYKRAMKRAAQSAQRAGAKGVKICCSGRLAGAEIARREWIRQGSVPLHTLRADIDYGFAEAKTTYGIIGVKVWLCKGEYQHI